MDSVKVALGNRGMTVEAARQCAKYWKVASPGTYVTERVSRGHFFRLWVRTTLPCSRDYHLERGEIPVHDAVGINCKNGTTNENQDAHVKYMGIGLSGVC